MSNRRRIFSLIVAATTAVATGATLFADDTNASPASTIDQRIDALDREIRELKRQREQDLEQAQARADQAAQKAQNAPIVSAGSDGFALKSADGNFVLRLLGYAQADGRFYLADQSHNGVDTFLLRRVRPILEGTVYRDFDFRIMPDFGNGASSSTILQDAYVEWHYWPWLKLRAGKYKVPVGLEWLQRDPWTSFAERGLPTDLVPQRDVGAQLSGDLFGGAVTYAAGVFNGVPDGTSGDLDSFDSKDGAARIFIQPFKTTDIDPLKGLGFGAGGSIGNQQFTSTTTNLAVYKTTGQNTFFSFAKGTAPDGLEYRLSPQGYYYWGPVGLLGEYVMAEQKLRNGADLRYVRNSAWQVEGSFVLTGENASYNGVTPLHPFDLKNGRWGAFELVARYGDLHLDPSAFNRDPTAGGLRFASPITSAQEAREWGVGVNWYLNKDLKLVLDYEQTAFDGGAGTATVSAYSVKNREMERTIFTRVQFSF
jgi:phosphate-selective porin OprO/OprP